MIHVEGVTFDEAENDPPVAGHPNGVKALVITGQRMQPVACDIAFLDGPRGVDCVEPPVDP